MAGVQTAIIGFIFVCLIFPSIIKNKAQFYWALIATLLGMFLQSLAVMFSHPAIGADQVVEMGGFWRTCNALNVFLDIFAVVALVLAAGGLTPRQLATDLSRAYEVMRRGETETTTIIPIPGQQRLPEEDDEDQRPLRYALDDPVPAPPKKDPGSIPLE